MAIQFACPYCDKVSSVPDSFAGKQGRCPSCQKVIEVPDPQADEPADPAPASDGGSVVDAGSEVSKACPYCGESIKAVAKKCKYCGEFLDKGMQRRQPGGAPTQHMGWAIASLVVTVLLCLPFTPLSIASLVFASQVSTKHAAGDLEGARKASSRARLWAVLSIVLPIALLVVFMIISAFV